MSRLLEIILLIVRLPGRVAGLETIACQQQGQIKAQQEYIESVESRMQEFDVGGKEVSHEPRRQ